MRGLRRALSPRELYAPREWGLTVAQDRLFAALRARTLDVGGVIAATRTNGRKRSWEVERPQTLATVYIYKLRQKLKAVRAPWRIVNDFGVGWRAEPLP